MKYHIRQGLAKFALLALALSSLYGCSVQEELPSSSREIRLGVQNATRAINSMADLVAVGDNLGVYGVLATDASGSVSEGGWTAENLVMDNVHTSGVDASTGTIYWPGSYFYPIETDRYVRFCAYHPYASGDNFSVETSTEGNAPKLHFQLTGQEDLMFAGPVVGNVSMHPDMLTFRHQLTQLSFCIVDAGGAFSGKTIDSITFTDTNTSGEMDLNTGEVRGWSAPAEIAVPDMNHIPMTGTPDAPQAVGGEVMLQPGCSSFHIRVVTSLGTFKDVEIHPTSIVGGVPETTFAAGRSYLITLTFHERNEIAMGSTVTPWQFAGTGAAEVK